MYLSKRAGVKSDKPAFKSKEKSDSGGTIYRYDEKHLKKRQDLKSNKLKKLEKDIDKVRKKYVGDLKSDDERTRAIAAIVGIMDHTSMRIGNESSAKEGTYGATTLKVKHIKGGSGNMTFDFPGKGLIEQNVTLKNNEVIKVIRDLMKGKKANDFIFEIDGKKIWDRAVNRYLSPLGISAKDIRGFHANRLMKEMLKKKDFKEALEEVAEIVGHEPATLKNQYLEPELVEKYEKKDDKADKKDKKKKAFISSRAEELSTDLKTMPAPQTNNEALFSSERLNALKNIDIDKNVPNYKPNIVFSPESLAAWRFIAPFLLEGSYITSGYRNDVEQARIILDNYLSKTYRNPMWVANKGWYHKNFSKNKFSKAQVSFMKYIKDLAHQLKKKYPSGNIPKEEDFTLNPRVTRFINKINKILHSVVPEGEGETPQIADIGKSKHKEGTALDISGNFGAIRKVIIYIDNNLSEYISIGRHYYEDNNKAYHVEINGIQMPDTQVYREELLKFWKPGLVKTQSVKLALDRDTSMFLDSLEEKYFGRDTGQVSLRGGTGIKSGVKTNALLLNAWKTLRVFLPAGAVMTSGARTEDDQIGIINFYWGKSGLSKRYPEITDPIKRSAVLRKNNWIVGPPITKGRDVHLKGRAFDVSGVDLDTIVEKAKFVSSNSDIPVVFSQILKENKNNAVHIGVRSAEWDPGVLRKLSASNIFKTALSLEDIKTQMGFGILDDRGDWFDKSPMFRHKPEEPDYKMDASEKEAKDMSRNNPDEFFYKGLHKEYPDLELDALKNIIKTDPKFYFLFKYNESSNEKMKDLAINAAELLAEKEPRAFFYYHLHHDFPELGRGSIIHLINIDPRSYGQFGLEKDYPDYAQMATDAINIYDPTKIDIRDKGTE